MQAHGGSIETSGLGDVFDAHTSHLTVPHCTFLRHWDRLIDLEAREIEVHFLKPLCPVFIYARLPKIFYVIL